MDIKNGGGVRLFGEHERIPFVPVNNIAVMVAEAVWGAGKTQAHTLTYKNGYPEGGCPFNACDLEPEKNKEYSTILNDEPKRFEKNLFPSPRGYKFNGWKLYVDYRSRTFAFLQNDKFALRNSLNDQSQAKLFSEGEAIPYIPFDKECLVIAEAVWEEKRVYHYARAIKRRLAYLVSRFKHRR